MRLAFASESVKYEDFPMRPSSSRNVAVARAAMNPYSFMPAGRFLWTGAAWLTTTARCRQHYHNHSEVLLKHSPPAPALGAASVASNKRVHCAATRRERAH